MTDLTNELRAGDLIQHTKFGLGKVLDVKLQHVLVHFKDDNLDVRKLAIDKSPLTVPEVQTDARLDSLPAFSDGKFEGKSKRIGLDDAIAEFVLQFPKGFEDPAYAEQRALRAAAHALYESTLGGGLAEELLAADEVAEITQQVVALIGPTKLLSKFELIALRDGLGEQQPHAKRFFGALLEFVKEAPDEAGFEKLVAAIGKLPSTTPKARVASWPVLTVLPFLARPDLFMYLKPEPTVACALRLRFDLHYDPSLQWVTYNQLMTLSNLLLEKLRPLGARDYIDVQSFLSLI
jgi:hypothetical protein